jgi:rhamnogalacturonyl hydrolase YesR
MPWVPHRSGAILAGLVAAVALVAAPADAQPSHAPDPGRSDPAFSQPSIAAGVDYTVPTRDEIKVVLDRVLDNFVRSSSFQVIDTATGKPITDFITPVKTAAVDTSKAEFNDYWNYPFGVVLAAMLNVTDVTGDARFADYTAKSFDFVFNHYGYFRRQAAQFGVQPGGLRRMVEFHELDDCGAMGAALAKYYARKPDPRMKPVLDRVDEHVAKTQFRLPDGTLARQRPWPVAVWGDDAYMSVPFLSAMGKLTGERKYYDDAARQIIGMSAHLFHEETGLYDHTWFEHAAPYDPVFYWGRGAGWVLMSMAELLSVLPEDHPDREKVLTLYRKAVAGVVRVQGSSGLWHQLLDKTDSYEETSASAMFTFAIARGVNRGWIPSVYAPAAQTGWRAIAKRVRADGNIEGICVSTTAAADAVYYYNRPTDITAMQGHGAVLMAGAEVLQMVETFSISRTNNTFYYRDRK